MERLVRERRGNLEPHRAIKRIIGYWYLAHKTTEGKKTRSKIRAAWDAASPVRPTWVAPFRISTATWEIQITSQSPCTHGRFKSQRKSPCGDDTVWEIQITSHSHHALMKGVLLLYPRLSTHLLGPQLLRPWALQSGTLGTWLLLQARRIGAHRGG